MPVPTYDLYKHYKGMKTVFGISKMAHAVDFPPLPLEDVYRCVPRPYLSNHIV